MTPYDAPVCACGRVVASRRTTSPSAALTAANAVRQVKAQRQAGDFAGVVAAFRAEGATSLGALAGYLNPGGNRAPRGGAWGWSQVPRRLSHLDGMLALDRNMKEIA
jgi:hypothetical protein